MIGAGYLPLAEVHCTTPRRSLVGVPGHSHRSSYKRPLTSTSLGNESGHFCMLGVLARPTSGKPVLFRLALP